MVRMVSLCVAYLLLATAVAIGADQYAPTSVTAAHLFVLNRKAIGYEGRGAYRSVEETRSSSGDVWTTVTEWNGDDFRATIRQGSFIQSYGSYHGQKWNQDANGLVMLSTSSFQLMDPYASALRGPDAPNSGVTMLGMTATDPKEFVVQVSPSSGLLQRQYYDARTYLLTRREETDYDGHHQAWEYDDYRTSGGSTLAHLVRYYQDGTTVTRQTQLISYDRLTSSPDLSIPASRPLFSLGNAASVVVPADFTADAIFVPVVINGRQMDFQLDSGSSDIVIDPGAAKDLAMATSGATRVSFGGDYTIADTRAATMSVGALSATDVAMATVGFDRNMMSRRVRGLLGTDFIGSGALQVNFAKNTLTLYNTVPSDLASEGWFSLPIRLDDGVPMVKANFSGLDGEFVVDLGAFETTLYPHYFTRYPGHIPPGTPDAGEALFIGNRVFGFKSLTMRSMILGDWVFGQVQVMVPSAQFAQDRDYDGLIGINTLQSFDLIFDYANSKLWMRPLDVK